jgi:hypothetical protein
MIGLWLQLAEEAEEAVPRPIVMDGKKEEGNAD